MSTSHKNLTLPFDREELVSLVAGEKALLSGFVYTMRDAGHQRALDMLEQGKELPFDLNGQTLFYAGPTPTPPGRLIGSVGPTTASRMDSAAPILYREGVAATIGKGARSRAVADACREYRGIYFAATGGAAALLSRHITAAELIAWEDLGTEALVRLTLEDFPVFVGIDTNGTDLYGMI